MCSSFEESKTMIRRRIKVVSVPYPIRKLVKQLEQNLVNTPPLLYWYKKKILRLIESSSWSHPQIVYLESTNDCNASCVFCPRRRMTRDIAYMSMDLYRKLIDECVAIDVDEVRLHTLGESLLDPYIVDKIVYAKSRHIPLVLLYTNGKLLDRQMSQQLIQSGLGALYISIDAFTNETYRRTGRNLDFNTVKQNIHTFCSIKEDLGRKTPILSLAYTVTDDNRHEVRRFQKYWRPFVDYINISGSIDFQENPVPRHEIKNRNNWPCYYPWNTMVVLSNGEVTLCCLDINGEVKLGSVATESLSQIWKGRRYRRVRESQLHSLVDGPPLCSVCSAKPLWSRFVPSA